MLSITFYGGVGEIGGNKILLEDGGSRVFLDFGLSFGQRSRYFEEYLKPRPGSGLLDLLEMRLVPALPEIYREDLVFPGLWERFGAPAQHKDKPDAVLLSHAHLDHSGYISLLKEDIPVYCSAMTAFISKAMQDNGGADFERQVCYSSKRKLVGGYLASDGPYQQRCFVFTDGFPASAEAKKFWTSSPAKTRQMVCLPSTSSTDRVGSLPLCSFSVDHSVPGASAYALETSLGWVGYTGDLRRHGQGGRTTEHFIEEMRRLKPYVLICEGTGVRTERHVTEEEVYLKALEVVRESTGMVIADFSPRNVERLLIFERIASETSRKLVILAKDAYLLGAARLASGDIPALGGQSDVLIYREQKARLANWEEQVWQEHSSLGVGAPDIKKSLRDFILCFSFWDVNEVIDIAPTGGTYLYSSSEAWDEEQQMDMRRLAAWIEHFGLRAVGLPKETADGRWEVPEGERGFHASGHASAPQLIDLVRQIQPKYLIPVHTENPAYFADHVGDPSICVLLPEQNKTMEFPR